MVQAPLEVFAPATGVRERLKEPTPLAELPDIVAGGRAAQADWAATPLPARARALRAVSRVIYEHAERFAEQLHRANGKPLAEAYAAEIYPTAASFRFFAARAPAQLRPRTLRLASMPFAYSKAHFEPLGVVGIIAPFNFPLLLSTFDVPAALMAGNAVVIKMSEHAVAVGEMIEEIVRLAGLAPRLVQVVYGHGEVGAALIESGVDKICFIGSTRVGRRVYQAAAQRMIPCVLELGGKDAALLLEDADLDDAADGILWAGLANSGQACSSVETVYVPEQHAEAFAERLRRRLEALAETDLGTMSALFQKRIVEQHLADALARGARVVAEKPRAGDNPFVQAPVILADVPDEALAAREPNFGPLLVLRRYRRLEEAVAAINAGEYGLTNSIWSRDRRRAAALAAALHCGTVTINEHMLTPGLAEAPWSGRKASGLGLAHSVLSIREFCHVKYVYHDRGLLRFKFFRYPYTADKARWFRIFLRAQLAPSPLARAWAFLRSAPAALLRR